MRVVLRLVVILALVLSFAENFVSVPKALSVQNEWLPVVYSLGRSGQPLRLQIGGLSRNLRSQ